MISGAHLDSLTQEPLCDSPSKRNHSISADATSSYTPPTRDCSSFFLLASQQPSLLLHSLAHFPFFFPHTPELPFLPHEPPPFTSLLPALADCHCLWVSCGHFSFIILSKSGMALAQGDWVSVKHQDLIEFVLKWVMEGTLLMQS